MLHRQWEDYRAVDSSGRFAESTSSAIRDGITARGINTAGAVSVGADTLSTHTAGTAGHADATINGTLLASEEYDVIAINLTAGVTYSFAERGLEDPYLLLFGPDFGYITEDDDGGLGRSSMITVTPVVTGTYYLLASSWYHLDPGAPGYPTADAGNYSISIWRSNAATDVGATFATAAELELGTTYGNLEAAGDRDMYAIDLAAGQLYSFTYSGGIASGGDWEDPTTPGESIGILRLYDADGNVVAQDVNYETSISFYAQQGGTYYLRVDPYESTMTGGYTLDVAQLNPADYNPLDSIDWRSANDVPFVDTNNDGVGDTAYVYFAPAGENFGEFEDDGVTPMTTYGWQQFQIDGVMNALEQYEHILGVNYVITTDVNQATFRLITSHSEEYGARFYPQDPSYGTQQGIGTFNLLSGGFTLPASLDQGGYSFAVVLHEFGHAHGLAHPHDNGGGSDVMLGVGAAQGSLGIYNLNQGVYTVMSYNDGWQDNPDGVQPFTRATIGYGWSGTLSAFDIAQLQIRYGVHDYNTGDNVYTLPSVEGTGAYYQTIWDTGGNDTIAYNGAQDAQIDLLAATLDYTPTGGGVVSFAHNVHAGFTIANGVVIENATGGSGDDVLLGNSANNLLAGNGGDDSLFGREGIDTATYASATSAVTVNLGAGTATGGAGNDVLDSIENLIGSGFGDRLIGSGGANTIRGGNGVDVVTLGGGNDLFVAEVGTASKLKTGSMSVDIITDFNKLGDDTIDLSGFGTEFHFRGTNANKNAGDISYKTYTSVTGAENALGFDIDGHPGAAVNGPVTVVYGNLDGGSPDFAIILLNTNSVTSSDFLYA